MSIIREHFYNIKCDVCGRLCNEESWQASPEFISDEAQGSEWLRLGGKDYCPDCWDYNENGDIVTKENVYAIIRKIYEYSKEKIYEKV